ncbi:MAG: hypothetical protein DI531_03215 [Brevundimonas sp.]|uniref:hypothetical protein n=1 Tax=Brevundimonas sp. TaxID=1871086 RepID=UPI000DB805E5|nr:hypothetical protein [Brevundimonas sp.]MBN9465813.1 hypothetical protein [Brevundimonas sp.]PZU76296.1 MAG: hypothetical protein DI531_03215 [Brevundimonas sp.]
MKTFSKIAATAFVPLMAATVMAASPADAQSRYRDHDRGRDDSARNALIGAAVGGLAGALYGNGDGNYIAGGALAGAALGAVASNRGSGCEYYRGGQCYRNQGHWEREHGINSRDYGYDYRYGGRQDYRDYRDYRRDQRYDRRNYDRDYRYDRRW